MAKPSESQDQKITIQEAEFLVLDITDSKTFAYPFKTVEEADDKAREIVEKTRRQASILKREHLYGFNIGPVHSDDEIPKDEA